MVPAPSTATLPIRLDMIRASSPFDLFVRRTHAATRIGMHRVHLKTVLFLQNRPDILNCPTSILLTTPTRKAPQKRSGARQKCGVRWQDARRIKLRKEY